MTRQESCDSQVMKKDRFKNKKWYNNAVAIVIGVAAYVILTNLGVITGAVKHIASYFTPIFLGCVMAYMVNPLASLLQRKVFYRIRKEKLQWPLSVLLAMVIVLLLFGCLLLMLIPQLIESIMYLISNTDTYIMTLEKLIGNVEFMGIDLGNQLESMMNSSEDLIKNSSEILSASLKKIASASADIGKNIFNMLIASILSIYLLMAKDNLKSGSKRLLRSLMPQKWYDIVINFVARCNDILVRYIVFSLLDAVIVGGATACFMAMCKMQYVGLIAVVCGVTNLIPSFGPVIGAVVGGFILLLVNPWHALMFLGFTLILQTLDGYVIKPKLFGDSLGVSGLLILISIVLFGNIFGVVGILLAIPLAAIIDFTYEEGILPLLEARRAKLDAEEAAGRAAGEEDSMSDTAINVLTEMSEGKKRK